MDETNFSNYLLNVAKKMRRGTIDLTALTEEQWREVSQIAGNPVSKVSPKCLARAIEQYLDSLREQAAVGQSFFFGNLKKAFRGLSLLPEPVRLQIDRLIWEVAGGKPLDPRLPEAQELIASAIMHSLEIRMGIAS